MYISIEELCFGFGEKKIFNGFNLVVGGESPVVFLGPSGCGKTTLLRLLAGLLQPSAGNVLNKSGAAARASFMFQEPRLLSHLTVLENVMLPMIKVLGAAGARERSLRFLRLAALTEKAAVYPASLSGGEQQRASMARSFTYDAPLLLLDEPFQSLDIPLRISLMETLLTLLKEDERTSIIVTHDPREALYLGRRIIVLGKKDGSVSIALDELNETSGARRYANAASYPQEERLIAALFESSGSR